MSSLYERLAALRTGGPAGTAGPPDPGLARDGGGLEKFGFVRLGDYLFRRELFIAGPAPAAPPRVLPAPNAPLFFDTETTGLGPGNVIFLAGLARPEAGGLSFRQLFLSDFPGEADFLGNLAAELDGSSNLVSFNGAAFDLPMLRARSIVNRLVPPAPPHTDLIHVSRRLWRRPLGDCSLANLERQVLGVRRELDVPGALVPELYHRYLREGQAGLLEAVFQHNLQDVLALSRLLGRIDELLAWPSSALQPIDQTGLAVLLLRYDRARASARLVELARQGDQRALPLAARQLRLDGRLEEAAGLWRHCYQEYGLAAAGVELAKHLEHRRRDFAAALELVRTLLKGPLSEELREGLRHRRDRLARRLKPRACAGARGSGPQSGPPR